MFYMMFFFSRPLYIMKVEACAEIYRNVHLNISKEFQVVEQIICFPLELLKIKFHNRIEIK